MSSRTWIVMLVLLALNWGGFVLTLAYGLQREARRKRDRESFP
jgi:hypothetical protein